MIDLLQYIDKLMRDKGQPKYDLYPDLVITPPSGTTEFEGKNDLYFLVSAFSSASNPISGELYGNNNAIALRPHVFQTMLFKHQSFAGNVKIINNAISDSLYVEFLIVSPTTNY